MTIQAQILELLNKRPFIHQPQRLERGIGLYLQVSEPHVLLDVEQFNPRINLSDGLGDFLHTRLPLHNIAHPLERSLESTRLERACEAVDMDEGASLLTAAMHR